jgi:hypothetical protein
MTAWESASLIWVCVVQAYFVLCAAGLVLALLIKERVDGYEPRHRADQRRHSTWQSHGRVLIANLTVGDPADLELARAKVDEVAQKIEGRVEVWNRELLSGPLFDLPPAGPDAPERYEPAAGDLAYLELTDGSLRRTEGAPIRPHPARVETGEFAVLDLDPTDAYAGAT